MPSHRPDRPVAHPSRRRSNHRSDEPTAGPRKNAGTSRRDDAIIRSVDAIAGALITDARAAARLVGEDPMLGRFSEAASLLRSLVTRVGHVIPDVVALALEECSADFEVLREHRLPITETAVEIVKNNQIFEDVELLANTKIKEFFNLDLVILDRETRSVTLVECVRGSVELAKPRKNMLLRKLRAAGLSARSALESEGHRVNSVEIAVFDRYGAARFRKSSVVCGEAIDNFLGAPIVRYLDRLDSTIRAALPSIVEEALGGPDRPIGQPHATGIDTCVDGGGMLGNIDLNPDDEDDAEIDEDEEVATSVRRSRIALDFSRCVGPAEWRRMMSEKASPGRSRSRH